MGEDIIIVIAGNKFDLIDKNEMDKQKPEIESFCARVKCEHFYISAKAGLSLGQPFDCLINSALKKVYPPINEVVSKKKRKKSKNFNKEDKKEKKEKKEKKVSF